MGENTDKKETKPAQYDRTGETGRRTRIVPENRKGNKEISTQKESEKERTEIESTGKDKNGEKEKIPTKERLTVKGTEVNKRGGKKEPKDRLINQTILKFLTIKPKIQEPTGSPVGNNQSVGKVKKGYGGEMFSVGEYRKPESKGTKPDYNPDNTSGNGKGRLLTQVLIQQQPGVVQKIGRDTELYGDSYEKSYTDGLERSIPECTEKQLLAGPARRIEYHRN